MTEQMGKQTIANNATRDPYSAAATAQNDIHAVMNSALKHLFADVKKASDGHYRLMYMNEMIYSNQLEHCEYVSFRTNLFLFLY